MPRIESRPTSAHFATVSDRPGASGDKHATAARYLGLIVNRQWDAKIMTRYLIVLAAAATATVSMMSADAQPTRAQPRVVTQTQDGKPIVLGTMVVTATALPDTEAQ
jgi:hypothetical protein